MDTRIITGDAHNMDLSKFDQYGVIVADPPWRYLQGEKGNLQGRAREQYLTMADEKIYQMPVEKIAKPDSVLFLWGTWPKQREAHQVIISWGFEYVTGFPWVKLNRNGHGIFYGVGYWVRGCSEFILIAKRGNVSPPRLKGFLGLMSPNLAHSRKPNDIHEIAETLPGPYCELFGRRSHKNWTVFGNRIEDIYTGNIHTESNGVEVSIQPRFF